VVKIANGLYALPGEEIDEYIYFSHRVPKGIFSMKLLLTYQA